MPHEPVTDLHLEVARREYEKMYNSHESIAHYLKPWEQLPPLVRRALTQYRYYPKK